MRFMVKIAVVSIALMSLLRVQADTETVNGITWTYTVANGYASIGAGSRVGQAIPSSTIGDVAIPSTLGGCPVRTIANYAFRNCRSLTSVVIPDSVTGVGSYAFQNCSSLTSIVVPDSVTSIGSYAFQNCSSLLSIIIPDSVQSVLPYSFSGCSSLTNVVTGAGVSSVGSYAFQNCSSLTSVVVPDSVTSIGSYAFQNCSSLTNILIGAGVSSVYNNMFNGCPLKAITVSPENKSYSSQNGLLLSKDGKSLIIGVNGDVVIPDGVTNIGGYAFQNCSSLMSVVIPDSVTSIGSYAFQNCSSLTNVVMSDSVTSIGSSAFIGCNGLADERGFLVLHNTLYGYSGSMYDLTIPDGVKNITTEVFRNNSSIKSISIPNSVTNINTYSFSGCSSLTNVLIGAGVSSIGSYAFSGCSALMSVVIPGSVTIIGSYAFQNCSSFLSIIIPDSVQSVLPYSFSGCSSLTNVVIGAGVSSIGNSAFQNCSSLTSVVISDSVTSIGSSAFYNCSSLKSVEIPDSVTSIGGSAFQNCSSLTNILIGAGVSSVYNSMFKGCPLKTIAVSPENKTYSSRNGLLLSKDGKSLIIGVNGDVVIPDGVTNIGGSAFQNCSSLTNVVIGAGVSTIGNSAFQNCSSLVSVLIPDSVTSIGSYAFQNCSSLTAVHIPENVNLGNQAFSGCVNLLEESGFLVWDGILWQYYGNDSEVAIPDNVSGIARHAFSSCNNLMRVSIGVNVASIADEAFYQCASLIEFSVSPDNAFFAAKNRLLLSKDGTSLVAGVGGDVIIPHGVANIASSAFQNSRSLTSVQIPDSLMRINDKAFYHCSSLTNVVIGSGVTSIGDSAFGYCSSLASVVISDGVTSIGNRAFEYCTSLANVVIGVGVTSVDSWVFSYCKTLDRVEFNGDAPRFVGNYLFNNVSPNCTAYVSRDSTGWNVDVPGTWMGIKIAYYDDAPASDFEWTINDGCVTIDKYIGTDAIVSIPSLIDGMPVTVIGEKAFYGLDFIRSVTMSDSITNIMNYAFSLCGSLKSVRIPDNVRTISDYAFSDCYSLARLLIGNGVTSIGTAAFRSCRSLAFVAIPDSVETISDYAFSGCASLEQIMIGRSVAKIGDYVFEDCNSLEKVEFYGNAPQVGNASFAGVGSDCVVCVGNQSAGWNVNIPGIWQDVKIEYYEYLPESDFEWYSTNGVVTIVKYIGRSELVNIPSCINGMTVADIADDAFSDCHSFVSMSMPDTFTSIRDYMFAYSYSLTNVVIGSRVTHIGKGAFMDCENLICVAIPDSVAKIEDGAFYMCYSLKEVHIEDIAKWCSIPFSVGRRRGNPLEYAHNLYLNGQLVKNLVIPNDVTSVSSGAFIGCTSLVSVAFSDSVTNIDSYAFSSCSSLTAIEIPDRVTDIASYVFSGCSGLASVVVPDSVTNIDSYAFSSCSSLTNITIGTGVKSIGSYAFQNCSLLTSIEIPDNVSSIGYSAFANCSSLVKVLIGCGITNFETSPFSGCSSLMEITVSEDNDRYLSKKGMLLTKDGKTLIQGVNGTVVIPSCVTSIGNYAFSGRSGLVSVEIPDTVISINNYGFSGCSGLTSIKIPDSVTSIGDRAFDDCRSLTNVVIPDSVKSIGNWAFGNCSSLSSVVIPDSVTSIGGYAFYFCTSLASVEIPDSVTNISSWMFSNCSSLTNVVIPDSVTSIGDYAFYFCTSLASVEIPDSVTSISSSAFYYCRSLKKVVFDGNAPNVGNSVFDNVHKDCTIYVKPESTGWGVDIPGRWQGVKIAYIGSDCIVTIGGVATNVVYGTELTFRAPDAWSDDACKTQIVYLGTSFTSPVVTNEVTLTVTNDVDLAWDILATNYWLGVIQPSHGTITGAADGWYADGATLRLAASADAGYQFVSWTGDTVGCTTIRGAVLDVAMDRARSIGASFSAISYPIAYVDTKGAVNGNPASYTVEGGVVFTSLPDVPGLRFTGWSPASISLGATGPVTVTAQWDRVSHNVTIGGVATNVVYGTELTLCAPDAWTDDACKTQIVYLGTSFTSPVVTNEVTLMVTNDIDFAWDILATNYWLEVIRPSHGTITGVTDGWYADGATLRLTASADAGYQFASWTGDTVGCSAQGTVLNAVMDRARSIGATISAKSYPIAYVDTKGVANPNPAYYTVEGGVVFTSLPDVPGWRFAGWSPASISLGSTGPVTVTAQWERVSHNVTIGGVATNVAYGTELTFRAPDAWSDDACKTQIVYLGTSFTSPVVTNEVTITVTNDIDFAWDVIATNYWLGVIQPSHGAITGAADGWYADGATLRLAASADAGYRFASWTGDTVGCSAQGTVLNAVMDRARSIGATISAKSYPITYIDTKGVANSNPASYMVESGVVFTSLPDVPGWRFSGWSPASIAIGSTGAVTVTARWERVSHNVTIGGVATNVVYGTELTLRAPDAWTDDACKTQIVYLGTSFTSPVVTNEITLTVTNDIDLAWDVIATNYWLEVIQPAHGTITVATDGWYADGATLRLTASADAGYRFASWTGDTVGCTTIRGAVLDVAMDRARSIGATFSAISYPIAYIDTKGVANSNPAYYTVEGGVVFTSLPDVPGWRFSGWSPASIALGTTGPVTVIAQWERVSHNVTIGGVATNVVYGTELTFRAPDAWSDDACKTQIVYLGTSFTSPVVTNEVTLTVTNDIDFAWDILATNYWLEVIRPSHGAITGAADGWYADGATLRLAASADAGYRFASWTGDTVGCSAQGTVLNAVMDRARSIGATISAKSYPITYIDTKGVANSNPASYTVEGGVVFTSLPDVSGWRFTGWSPASIALGSTGPVTVTARWERVSHNVTIGGVATNVAYGTELTLRAPDAWSDDACKTQIVYLGTSFTSPVVTNEVTLTVTNDIDFAWDILATNFWLEVIQPAHGTITGATDGWYADGATLRLAASADAGYRFASWTGDTVGCSAQGAVLNVVMDCARSLTAVFERMPLSLGEAVNAENLSWYTEGDAEWAGEWMKTASDGVHAAKSGEIDDSQESVLGLSLEGAGILTFDWRTSCEAKYDAMRLEVDGKNVRALSGETAWANVQIELDDGQHDIRWVFKKGRSKSEGDDAVWVDNVVWSPVPAPTLSEALGNFNWETEGDVQWKAYRTEQAYEGGMCAAVRGLGDYECATIRTRVAGAGRLVFRWSASCEESYDWLSFSVDGEISDMITGKTGWLTVSVDLPEGEHELEWEFWKDEMDDPLLVGENIVMLDFIEWYPENDDALQMPERGLSEFLEWLKTHRQLPDGSSMKDAAAIFAGNIKASGKNVALYSEFLAGTDPSDTNSVFTAKIELKNGLPVVSPSPDLGEKRVYTIYAKKHLSESDWIPIKSGDIEKYNFFKITVSLP